MLNGLRGDLEVVQLLCGSEIAGTAAAAQSANFVYMVADKQTREAAVFDAAWEVDGVFEAADIMEYKITDAIYTHHHYDHAGRRGQSILEGAAEMAERGVQVRVHSADTAAVIKQCGLPDVHRIDDGDVLSLGGEVTIRCLHTPGHTPGSACFALSGATDAEGTIDALVTGDTLFVGAFGRVDLPTSDPSAMFASLMRLKDLDANGARARVVPVPPCHGCP